MNLTIFKFAFLFASLQSAFCVAISTAQNNGSREFLKANPLHSEKQLFVGTFTPTTGSGKGIYQFDDDAQTGSWKFRTVTAAGSPSFMIANKNKNMLYVVNELYNEEGQLGRVSSYKIDPNGNLVFINSQSSAGNGPTHLALDPTESFLLVANFGTGNLVVFPLDPNGIIGPISDDVLPASKDGQSPGVHMVIADPNSHGRVAAVCYGIDKVLFYSLDSTLGKLNPINAPQADGATVPLQASVVPGSGARHMVYSKNGAYFYVISETANTISVFDAKFVCNGSYFLIQTISTLPADHQDVSYAGGISLHPNGRFLYASNRGHDSIAVFSVNATSGVLRSIQFMLCGGAYPRHFTLSNSGTSMVIGNQNSNNVVEFMVDEASGHLLSINQIMAVDSPTCPLLV